MRPEKPIQPGSTGNSRAGLDKHTRESAYFELTPKGVRCRICPHQCVLEEGMTGNCKTHVAYGGKLYTLAYGNPCSVQIDPIEKKPLFHFLPSSFCLSIATAGCNFSCKNCQNWEISQSSPDNIRNSTLFPEQVVNAALNNGCNSIAYTYTEPTAYFEYALDTAVLAKSTGVRNLMISNGYINEKPLRELARNMDAANIDLKSFSVEIYKKLFGGNLQPVLNTLQILKEEGVWLEITNLLIPGVTDGEDQVTGMCEWLAANGFSDVPLHFNRFHPMYNMTKVPVTPISTLEMAREKAGKAGIRYVYIGNV
ncbi:MAG: AmmeMemoRadiSam system radical SAM enzyme, partial [Bacteroidota bacterium]